MPTVRHLLTAVPSEDGVSSVMGGLSGSGVRSSRRSISRPLLTAKLCSMQHAPMIWHKVWGIQQGPPRLIQASETGLQEAKGAFHHSTGTCLCFIVSSLSWGLWSPEWNHEMGSKCICRVTWKGKDRRVLVVHVPLVMSASWGRTVMPDSHVTHQPASCPRTRSVRILLGWCFDSICSCRGWPLGVWHGRAI